MRQPTTGNPENGKADFFGTGRTGLTDGIPSVETPTTVTAAQGNAELGELRNLVEMNGTALRPTQYDQAARCAGFRHAVTALLNPAGALNTGGVDVMRGVACDDLGTVVFVGDNAKIFTMAGLDGLTLTSRTPASAYAGNFRDVIWNGSLFIAVGDAGEVQTSPTGVSWTRRVTSGGVAGTAGIMRLAKNSSGRLVAVTNGAVTTITSTDGMTWTANTAVSGGTFVGQGIACDPSVGGHFVISGTFTGPTKTLAYSTDGLAWTLLDLTGTTLGTEYVTQVAAVEAGGFAALVFDNADSTQKMLASTDGIAWSVVNDPNTTTALSLAAERGGYALLPQAATGLGYVTGDGWTWSNRWFVNPSVANLRLRHLAMNGARFWIALGTGGDAGKATKSACWGL